MFLPVACRNVVGHQIAKDVIFRLLFADALGRFADDDAKLDFVVNRLAYAGITRRLRMTALARTIL